MGNDVRGLQRGTNKGGVGQKEGKLVFELPEAGKLLKRGDRFFTLRPVQPSG